MLKKHKIDSIAAGDTRYDQVAQLLVTKKTNPLIASFIGTNPVFLAGSCWPEDIEALKTFLRDTEVKIILAPHDVSEKMISQISTQINEPSIRYSTISAEQDVSKHKVLIIDSIGILAGLYSSATVAYVGGAFKQGLHNILEPAVYGIPVVFGPEIAEFPEAGELLKSGGGFSYKNSVEMNQGLKIFSKMKV